MTTAPKRRWPRFSLRTLFVVVTAFACWLGWNLHQVREHNRIAVQLLKANGISRITSLAAAWDDADGEVWKIAARNRLPFAWRFLGALPVDSIQLDGNAFSDDDCQDYSRLFPEAIVSRSKPWPPEC